MPIRTTTTLPMLRRPFTEPGATGPEVPGGERYRALSELGRGGMGTVERVWDRVLDREVVRKVIHAALWPSDESRFANEARITGRLQHPGVIPVHDLGQLPDGRPYYIMEEVQGRTLESMIESMDWTAAPEPNIRRVVEVLRRVAETVAYAHAQGVIHRDLKPANIMLGSYGEVRVVDWGLAHDLTSPEAASDPDLATSGASRLTRLGDVLGTPAYMPPEQALGKLELMGPWGDVYAIGATLYHALSGRPPYLGSAASVIAQVSTRAPEPLASAGAGRRLPDELCRHVEAAMARDPAQRPSAEAMAAMLADWLDGARRRETGLALVHQAHSLEPHVQALRQEAARLRAEAEGALAELEPWEPEERRHQAWALEERAAKADQEALLAELEMTRLLQSALEASPGLLEADLALARLYQREHAAAEARHDPAAAARFEALLRAHDRGEHTEWLSGDARLNLITDPPGAQVRLYRYEERQRRLIAVFDQDLGPTPLLDRVLPRGSYLLLIERPGRAPMRYPVLLERGGRWTGAPPDADRTLPVPLPPEDLGPDDLYVPPGWFWSGGDPDAVDPWPGTRRWVDAFVIRRHPVTNAEYLAFLDDLVAQGRAEEAEERLPRAAASEGVAAIPVAVRDDRGRYTLRQPAIAHVGGLRHPVTRVRWEDACAYARWEAARTGRPWRLPHDQEWEKAARGVDGRRFPWGDHFDATRASVINSRKGVPTSAEVDAFPYDESPYGLRGAAGNVRDWCANAYRGRADPSPRVRSDLDPGDPAWRLNRGGSFVSAPRFCALASRFADPPSSRLAVVGFRLARSL